MTFRPVLLLAFCLLGSCGRGSEDFAIPVARSIDSVAQAYDGIGLDPEVTNMIHGLKVDRTSPEPTTLLYTIHGKGDFPATVRLTFEADGHGTIMHVAIDFPKTEIRYDGRVVRTVHEATVEKIWLTLLGSTAERIASGEDISGKRVEISRALTALALLTNPKQLRLAQEMERYPEWYIANIDGLSDTAGWSHDGDAGGEDPGIAARMEERKLQQKEREEQVAAEENSRPEDYGQGD